MPVSTPAVYKKLCKNLNIMCLYIMSLSPVPEVPQEVALSAHIVTSAFVTWRPPPGQVEEYKVRPVYECI